MPDGFRIAAQQLFDGHEWRGPTRLTCRDGRVTHVEVWDGVSSADLTGHLLLPGLIDSAVLAEGYLAGPAHGRPFLPEEAFATLCLRFGVTGVLDLGAGDRMLHHLAAMSNEHRGPTVLTGGPRFVGVATQRTDVATDASRLGEFVDARVAAGARCVHIGSEGRAFVAAAREAAARHGIPLVRPLHDVADQPGLLVEMPDDGIYLVPQLEAHARWTIEGLVDARHAAVAAAFQPHARHFGARRGVIGRSIARDVLARLYGDRIPCLPPSEREVGDRLAEGRLLAASGAGAAGLVPGQSLWLDLERMGDPTQVMRAATGDAGRLWGLGGRIHPHGNADLVLLRHNGETEERSWSDAIAHVVVRGRVFSRKELDDQLTLLLDLHEENAP